MISALRNTITGIQKESNAKDSLIERLQNLDSVGTAVETRNIGKSAEDALIEKYQETMEILYLQLRPDKRFENNEDIKEAFQAWKERLYQKLKSNMNDEDGGDDGQYVPLSTYDGLVSTLKRFIKDF